MNEEKWGRCWECEHETPHKIISLKFFGRAVEMFSKTDDGAVKERLWLTCMDAYYFSCCKKCNAPSLFIDGYSPRRDVYDDPNDVEESRRRGVQWRKEIRETGECASMLKSDSYSFPSFKKVKFPAWTQDLEETRMLLFWEIHQAISMGLRSLAMMGIRALIDVYSTSLLGDIGGFKQKLQKLLDQKHISNTQYEHLMVIVDAGDAAGHRGYRPEIADLEVCLKIVEELLAEERYGEDIRRIRGTTPPRRS